MDESENQGKLCMISLQAGIFKPNAACFVSGDHEDAVMKVIRERAEERQVRGLLYLIESGFSNPVSYIT